MGEATGKLKTQMLEDLKWIKTEVEFYEKYVKRVPEEDEVEHFYLTCAFADCIHATRQAMWELEHVRWCGMPRHDDYVAGRIHPKFVAEYDGGDE